MARPSPARPAVIAVTLALALPAGACAASTPARGGHRASCKASRSRRAHLRKGGPHQVRCAKAHRVRHGTPAAKSHQLFFVAAGGVCPDADLAPTISNVRVIRAATLCLVNRERAAHGVGALHWNERLVAAAQAHTESMAYGDYFEHVGPGGETPLMRMRRTGYISSSRMGFEIGENIAWGSLWLGTPSAVVASWMASPGHRANILDPHYRDTGIGVSPHVAAFAEGQSGGIYTQDFGVRRTG